MAHITHDLYVSLGKYDDDEGKQRTKIRKVGEIYKNKKSEIFISLDALFNFGGLERKYGSDRVFVKCVPVKM